ncbi:MAG TPA: hypothetical protein PLM07_00270 [Candidatus Rifleibacterium sp.]|nr:hypothetical protein [Candidatus Rifleibacterium sp.]HPT44313.1 hypothetical protein [Candidatus Rifleibacterium sp.]
MLRYSLFSEFYLSRRQNAASHSSVAASHGSLALAPAGNHENQLPLCRANSRTWWETGWQRQR